MRVVIDTNIFVSSFFGGNPRKVIDLWKNGKIYLCFSTDIFDEYIEVLQRIGLKDESEIEELLHLFSKQINIIFTSKTQNIKAVKKDPDDDKFIECAVALSANVIITGDKEIQAIKEYKEIKIFSSTQFLEKNHK